MSRRPDEGSQGVGAVDELGEAELATFARRGSRRERRAAFRELHDRHATYLEDYLKHRLRFDRAAARDLAADAWRRAWLHFHRFEPDLARFRTWLTTIAENLAKNWRRDRDRDPQITFSQLVPGRDEDEADVEWEDPDAAPDQQARRRQLRRLIADAEDELPAPYRNVLQLREQKGMAYAEIADATGLPLGTVKSRIYRARRELRGHLVDRFSEHPRLLPESLRQFTPLAAS